MTIPWETVHFFISSFFQADWQHLVSFTVTGWVLRSFEFAWASLLALLFGLGFLLYPYMTWKNLRPTLKR